MKIYFILTVLMVLTMWSTCRGAEPEEPECDHIGYSPFSLKEEICGSDGQTYSNEKHLEFENCLYRREIKKVKSGWCNEEEGKRALEQRKKLSEEFVKRLEKASKEG